MFQLQKAYLPVLIVILITSCHQRRDMTDNYFHRGFIGDNIFQCIIMVQPDEQAAGLVKRRASALKKVKEQVEIKAAEALAKYCLAAIHDSGNKLSKNEVQSREQQLIEDFKTIASKGKMVMQYYNEDDSVVAVYRIKKRNLKKIIQNIADETSGKKENS